MNDAVNFTDNIFIRYKVIRRNSTVFGELYEDLYEFEIYRRPYFFNLLGKKRWEVAVKTNCFNSGKSFCEYLLK